MTPQKTSSTRTVPLAPGQADALRRILERDGFTFAPRPYTLFFAQKPSLTVAVYEKGPKVVLQGKGVEDFFTFHLEPEVLGGSEQTTPADIGEFAPHFGVDESGKGDFFGPLVIAGVYADSEIARKFRNAGVQDSKAISSDAKIRMLAAEIRRSGAPFSIVIIAPPRYNDLYRSIGNLNRLLAWGHARVIENLCAERPDCPRALSDKFANARLLERSLMEKGRQLTIEQRTKAESDPAVAAASILAREQFIDCLAEASRKAGLTLPRGASAAVKNAARQLVQASGPEILEQFAKTHFKTASELHSPPD